MNKEQKQTFNGLIGFEEDGKTPTYTGKFTIEEMNQSLAEEQELLKRANAKGNTRHAERINNRIVGIAQALVYASSPKNKPW